MEPFTTQIRVVVQIAKSEGLKVIASAGNEAKLDFLRSLGANVVFNYKTTDLETVLHEHGPLDLYAVLSVPVIEISSAVRCRYWDHVGNKTLSTVLGHMRERGRVILIGGTASYNAPPDPVTVCPSGFHPSLSAQYFAEHGERGDVEAAVDPRLPRERLRGGTR